MKRLCLATITCGVFMLGTAAPAFANPIALVSPGQHGQTCQLLSASPGRASAAPGSAFNTTSGIAGGVYAPNAQYDMACAQVSLHSS
jgi:hypothetical protein